MISDGRFVGAGLSTIALPRRLGWACVTILVLQVGGGCASARVRVPPRLDLGVYQRIGLVTFTVENAEGSLDEFATERFAERVLEAQPGVEVLELGAAAALLEVRDAREVTPAAIQALGADYGVPALVVGHLKVSDVQPSGGFLGDLRSPVAEATVSVELTVRLVSAESGGTTWRRSGAAREKVAQVGLANGVPYFAASDPNDAYGRLVDLIVFEVTRDLRPTWRRQ